MQFAHANAEHRKSVALMKVEQNTLFFEGPDLTGAGNPNAVELSRSYADHSQLARKRGDETAQNNGQDVRLAICANDDASLVADDDR